MKSGLKVKRRQKKEGKSREKTSKKNFNNNFHLGVSCVNNKKSLFYPKFFEFEEFSIAPFFWGSI